MLGRGFCPIDPIAGKLLRFVAKQVMSRNFDFEGIETLQRIDSYREIIRVAKAMEIVVIKIFITALMI